jgi:hypothetical protein
MMQGGGEGGGNTKCKFILWYLDVLNENKQNLNDYEFMYLKKNLYFNSLLILCTLGFDNIDTLVLYLSPLIEYLEYKEEGNVDLGSIMRFFLEIREAIINSLKNNEDETRGIFFKELIIFYMQCVSILLYIQREQIENLQNIVSKKKKNTNTNTNKNKNEGFPSYLTPKTKDRILLACLMTDNIVQLNKIIKEKTRLNIVRGEISKEKRALVNVNTISLLLRSALPSFDTLPMKERILIEQFKGYIWESQLLPMPKMSSQQRAFQSSAQHFFVYNEYVSKLTMQDILMQVCVFHLFNWFTIWRDLKLWPLTFEIRRRLLFLKQEEKWRLTTDNICNIFLIYKN